MKDLDAEVSNKTEWPDSVIHLYYLSKTRMEERGVESDIISLHSGKDMDSM